MSVEKKSKRQERRERIQQQEKRNRLFMIGLITVGASLLVLAFVWPNIQPIAAVNVIDPGTHPNANDNSLGDPNAPIVIEDRVAGCRAGRLLRRGTKQILGNARHAVRQCPW
jgi:hypothetical protein